MAFNFLGTIHSLEEFEELEEFVLIEAVKIDNRIKHLESEKNRYYELIDKFKKADLMLRKEYTKSDIPDANYLNKPRPIVYNKNFTYDALTIIAVDELKQTFLDAIKSKREKNEFKIKKIRDLIDQFTNEINLLTSEKSKYLETIDIIKTRFDNPAFEEVQKISEIDTADLQDGIKTTRKGAGRQLESGVIQYLVLSVNANQKTITFDTTAPAVGYGDKIILVGGKNDGEKTVQGFVGPMTLKILEPIDNTENPSLTVVTVKPK